MRAGPPADEDDGFTILELLVVMTIVAVLIAIAVPTLAGARQNANDRATQANVRNAFVAARIYYTDKQLYTDDPSELRAIEPSLSWTTTPLDASAPDRSVFVQAFSGGQVVVVAARTSEGRCFYLKDEIGGPTGGTYYDRRVSSGSACPVPSPADPAWGARWTS